MANRSKVSSRVVFSRYRVSVVRGRVHVTPVRVHHVDWREGAMMDVVLGKLYESSDLFETAEAALAAGREVLVSRYYKMRELAERHASEVRRFDDGDYVVLMGW